MLKSPNVLSDPENLNVSPVFRCNRVPVRIPSESLDAGDSVAEFLDNFPSVSADQAIDVLDCL